MYSSGILKASDCGTATDHAVLAVGYGEDYFKVRNSWSADWGDNGYIKLERTSDGKGTCGMYTDSCYPTL